MIHFNGQLIPGTEAHISPFDRGLMLGDGLFETVCIKATKPLAIDDHLRRLRQGAELLRIALPFAEEAIKTFAAELIAGMQIEDGILRITMTRGPADRGVWPVSGASPSLMLTITPTMLGEKPPAKAWIVEATKRNHRSPLSRCKSLNYGDSILATQEADQHGATIAIMVNTDDRVAETATGNLIAVYHDFLITPPVNEGALPGIMRAQVIERFGALEEPIGPDDLNHATELFAVNALGIVPISHLCGEPLACPAPGPVTMEVIAALQP